MNFLNKYTKQKSVFLITVFVVLVFSVNVFSFPQLQPFTTEDVLTMKSFSVQSTTEDGRYMAGTIGMRKDRLGVDHLRYGDPTYMSRSVAEMVILDTESKEMKKVFDEKVQVRSMSWSEDGKTLVFFLRKGNEYFLHTYDRERDRVREIDLKTNKSIASNSMLQWRPDGEGVMIALREEGWAEKASEEFLKLSEGPVIVQTSLDPFLDWDRVRSASALQIPAIVTLDNGEVKELLPEGRPGSIRQSKDGAFITYSETYPIKTAYERTGGTEYEMFLLDLQSLEPKVLRKRDGRRFSANFNNNGDKYIYSERGNLFIQSVFEEEGTNLTKDHEGVVSEEDTTKLRYSMMRWNETDTKIMVGSQKGYHLLDLETNEMKQIYQHPEDRETAPNLSISLWTPDEKYLYMTYSAKDKWERGVMKYDIENQRMQELVKDSNMYSRLRFTKDGNTIFFDHSDGDHPNELYVTKDDFRTKTKLVDLNPWMNERNLTRSELVKYLDVDGNELWGILYYPVNYEEGKKYPLVCEIYETFFNNGFNSNMNLITNAGFFGFRPSVDLEEGFPGEAWMKGVTAGINKLIERGLVDKDKLGVHGTSYGGYATNLIITQTKRFAAAINISGKVNIISFLGDSPKIGIRNYSAAERGQDRIGATLWEQPQKYIQHTAIMFADRIETPLLMLTGEGDWNVPATNQREMYYALRRLGKEVVWVHYMKGGHGAGASSTVEDYHDHWNRIINWYTEKFDEVEKKRQEKKD
ncbi:prolyl oligopeptidase family serine peptidase [candidate division KSB1 bacterium]